MTAYLIVNLDVHDAAAYEEYKAKVPALIARHGGEYIARGGAFEILEGHWHPQRLVMIRFPDRGAIRAFMEDADYAPLKALRQRVADTDIVAVDGIA